MLQQQDVFQKTEGKLYWYYEAEREIELLQSRLDGLERRRFKLVSMKQEYMESCAYQGAKAQYASERVQGKKSIYSNPIEPTVDAMEDLYTEIHLLWERRLKLQKKIDRDEEKMFPIQAAISYLNRTDLDICENKYRHHMSLEEIARNMNMSKGAVRNRRQKIVRHVSERLAAGD